MKLVLIGVAGALALMASGTAAADDWKAFSASSCQPYGTTTVADLTYNAYGVTNKSTTTGKSILCPLTSDFEGLYSLANPAVIHLGYSAGASSGNVYCTMYVGTKGSGLVSQSVNTAWIPPNTSSDGSYSVTFTSAPAVPYPALPLVAVCTLSARTSLNALWLSETGATDIPPAP